MPCMDKTESHIHVSMDIPILSYLVCLSTHRFISSVRANTSCHTACTLTHIDCMGQLFAHVITSVRTVVHYLAVVCKQNLSNQTTHGAFRRLKPHLAERMTRMSTEDIKNQGG